MTQTSKSYSIPSAILSWSKLSLAFQIQKEGLSPYLSMVGVSKNLQPCFKAARVILVFSICVITTIVKENSEVWVVHFSPQSQGENIVRNSTFSWKFYIGIKCTKPNQMTTGFLCCRQASHLYYRMLLAEFFAIIIILYNQGFYS